MLLLLKSNSLKFKKFLAWQEASLSPLSAPASPVDFVQFQPQSGYTLSLVQGVGLLLSLLDRSRQGPSIDFCVLLPTAKEKKKRTRRRKEKKSKTKNRGEKLTCCPGTNWFRYFFQLLFFLFSFSVLFNFFSIFVKDSNF